MKRLLLLGALGLLVSAFPGCGGSSNSPTTPVVTQPPAPVTTSLFTHSHALPGRPSNGWFMSTYWDVPVPSAGTVTVSLDWTHANNNLDLIVTKTNCYPPPEAYLGHCTAYGADTSPRRKPASAVFSLTEAGSVRVYAFNLSMNQESGVVNVLLTH
jgi:hypothetical protein